MKKLQEKINITAPYGKMPPIEILASNIEAIAKLGRDIKNSGLNERALLVLLNDITGINKTQIKQILDALPKLQNFLTIKSASSAAPR